MIGIVILTIVALFLSILIVIIDNKFNVIDAKQEEFLSHLPGFNCGMCGYSGCKAMSEAMMDDINNYKKCKPLRGEKLKMMEEYINYISNN